MLEWLVAIGATEVGKAVLEQGLKLSQSAAEDYVKDFLKGWNIQNLDAQTFDRMKALN